MSGAEESRKQRPFPRNTVEDALRIAKTILDLNNGKPMKRIFIADHLKIRPDSTNFKYLISASFRYGLTQGNEKSEFISLTPLGESIVRAKDAEKTAFLQEAVQKIPVFHNFYERYRDAKLPTDEYAKKLLKDEFQVPSEHLDECLNILITNGRFAGLIREVAGATRVVFETATSATPVVPQESEAQGEEGAGEEKEEKAELLKEQIKKPRVFISHSKNKKIVDQIKQILDFGQFEYVVAEETETTAIPIPDKIFGLMRDCDCAIINVSADEQEKRADETYGINPNVLVEIGAAFLKYNKKVILLVDKRINLPSNLQGLYRSEYEGDELTFTTAMKLQKALTDFRKL
ncbi:MAG: TIR domain-containing protein [Candidatus Bathyarchaeia archaeon]|jgi:predicted nucleotide-binding protein